MMLVCGPTCQIMLRLRNSLAKTIGATVAAGFLAAVEVRAGTLMEEGQEGAGHSDPFAGILLVLGLVIAAAMAGRAIAAWSGQPPVLGELLIGVLLGNLLFWIGGPLAILIMHQSSAAHLLREVWKGGYSISEAAQNVFSAGELAAGGVGDQLLEVMTGPLAAEYTLIAFSLWSFSNLGVILLLFVVGLESSVGEMLQVGPRALLVALLGVVAPFALGYGVAIALVPDVSSSTALFLGATMVATSVGITARVFKDLGKLATAEAKMILGAAVIDDVLGLVILALVAGLVSTGALQTSDIVQLIAMSALFLGAVILIGERVVRTTIASLRRFETPGLKTLLPLVFAFLLAWLANQIGLASIVGAFAAGLLLSESFFAGPGLSSQTIEELIEPLERVFAPLFFVLMGMQVNLASFLQRDTLLLALAFIVVAVIGKLISGLPAGSRLDSLSVGIGMVPRGEVGLIFASIGKGLGVMDDGVFSAVVMMVIVTTLVAPIGLKWSLARSRDRS